MSLYALDDVVWCERCKRPESVGAVLHDGPYTPENSHLLRLAADRRNTDAYRYERVARVTDSGSQEDR